MPSPARLAKRFRTASTNGRLGRSLFWQASEDPFKRPYKILSGSRDPRKPRTVSLLVGKAQMTGCLKVWMGKWSVGVGRMHPVTNRKASFNTLFMRRHSTQRHASCPPHKKKQLVGSLEVLASLHQCNGPPVAGWRVPKTVEQDNEEHSSCLQRGFRCSAKK